MQYELWLLKTVLLFTGDGDTVRVFQDSTVCTAKQSVTYVPGMDDWCDSACNDDTLTLCKPNLCQCP